MALIVQEPLQERGDNCGMRSPDSGGATCSCSSREFGGGDFNVCTFPRMKLAMWASSSSECTFLSIATSPWSHFPHHTPRTFVRRFLHAMCHISLVRLQAPRSQVRRLCLLISSFPWRCFCDDRARASLAFPPRYLLGDICSMLLRLTVATSRLLRPYLLA